jgi:hypothetical protein
MLQVNMSKILLVFKSFHVESFVWIRREEIFVLEFFKSRIFTRTRVPHVLYTRKNLASASLATSRHKVVFALHISSCQQVWNKLLAICINLVDIIRLVKRLFQQVRYSHAWYKPYCYTLCRQPCNILVISWLYQNF